MAVNSRWSLGESAANGDETGFFLDRENSPGIKVSTVNTSVLP
jgi:hypothetical protein